MLRLRSVLWLRIWHWQSVRVAAGTRPVISRILQKWGKLGGDDRPPAPEIQRAPAGERSRACQKPGGSLVLRARRARRGEAG